MNAFRLSSLLDLRRLRLPAALLMAAALALLQACGGGGTVAGVGSGGSGLATGTVSGFGSVFVDGVEIEDAHSYNVAEAADGSTSPAAVKLGQRVRVERDAAGAATRMTVEAAVIGPVTSVNTTSAEIVVLGQLVQVNTSAAAGPLTVFGGGYLALADVKVGDAIEVHGVSVPTVAAGTTRLRASRIDKLAALNGLRLMGVVSLLDSVALTFAINGMPVNYAGATVVTSGTALANGETVAVWAPVAGSGSTLQASRVRVVARPAAALMEGAAVQASGVVTNFDSTQRSFSLGAVQVSYGAATLLPPGAALANGVFARVAGTLDSTGGIAAVSVLVRQESGIDDASVVSLVGAISGFLDPTSFVVRNVPVDASAIDATRACPGRTLANGVAVQVKARIQPGTDVVKAISLACPDPAALPPYIELLEEGTADSVDMAAETFALVREDGSRASVRWSDQTVFQGTSPGALARASVIVEGYLDAGVLVAREIRTPGQRDADRFDPGNGGGAWTDYDNQFRPPSPSP